MTPRKPPGKRLVESLNAALPPNFEWDEAEAATLALIERAEDRCADLRQLFDAEMAKPVPTRRAVELAGELRLHEAQVAKLIAELDPCASKANPKSRLHQKAAQARWRGAS
ncbi:hypothetical protein H7J77_12325 [Mycolicibacillus parakoreensis]|uniref:Transposase n=1 Tax=Mycolicibacillus parakoreensis TaxID=1069221 RepID=A0ABY3TY10_9MYCO|nr:hypothetical protein [Mycolicibacillus parakoreensis]MCV7316322.1 hypothetical protein [Mycolicibacillus parakoreensis]ULN52568.1 hypothetical protein MIU77_17305 [Mycolicibacillus parakoreensis]